MCSFASALQNFENLLRNRVSSITNSSLMNTLWIQASLPIRNGDLGYLRGTSLALSAFFASAASTLDLKNVLLATCGDIPNTKVLARLVWTSVNVVSCPQMVTIKSNECGMVLLCWDFNVVVEQATTDINKARLLVCRILIVVSGYMIYLCLHAASALTLRL